MAEAGSHLQSLQTRLKNRHCPIQQQITFHLVKKTPQNPILSLSLSTKICVTATDQRILLLREQRSKHVFLHAFAQVIGITVTVDY